MISSHRENTRNLEPYHLLERWSADSNNHWNGLTRILWCLEIKSEHAYKYKRQATPEGDNLR